MFRTLAHYTTALVTLLAMAAIYMVTIDRWLQSPPVKALVERDSVVVSTDDPNLADLFPPSAWQRSQCKHLKTQDGMLLFQNWEQTSDNQWKLWPITVVVGRGLSPEAAEMPILIESDEGAEIKFAQQLDIMSGGAPPIEGGQIIGDVFIKRAALATRGRTPPKTTASQTATGTTSDETFTIETSNVFIDSQKLWTTHAIRMRIGDARIRGQDLTLEFNPGATRPGSAPDAESILRRMELIYLHEFTLPLAESGLWKASQGDPTWNNAAAIDRLASGTAAPAGISVACDGRVLYDFQEQRLSLRNSVTLSHWIRNGPLDRFECESLTMTLREPMDQTITRHEPIDWVEQIEAQGTPALAKLQSFDCDFTAESILFNAVNGEVRAVGKEGVGIRYGMLRGRIASLIYLFNPREPRRLGVLAVDGGGRLEGADPEIPVRAFSWVDRLLVRNEASSASSTRVTNPTAGSDDGRSESPFQIGKVHVSIDGDCSARFADGGTFRGDSVEAELTRAIAGTAPASSAGSNEALSLHPERVTATGNVQLSTSAIDAQTESLKLFFQRRSAPSTNVPAAANQEPSAPQPAPRSWVAQPASDEGNSEPDAPVAPVARPRPVIRGKMVVAQLTLAGSEIVARDTTVLGGVEMLHTVETSSQSLPLKMRGQDLRMREGYGDDEILLRGTEGKAARLDLGDGYFVGPEIHILPTANFVEIDHAGEFQMPTAMLPTGFASEDSDGADQPSIRWTQSPRCRWNDSMVFDGQVARLLGGVKVTASLINGTEPWELYLDGEELQVHLQGNMQMRQAESLRNAEVGQIALGGSKQRPVYVEAFRRGDDGTLQARHVLHTPLLTFYPVDGGHVVGDGPGWYRVWLRGGLANLSQRQTPAQNAAPPNPDSLTGVHLLFHDSMVGDLQKQTLQFSRGVRLGTRAVSSWEEAFDAAKMTALAVGETTIDSERLRLQVDPAAATMRRQSQFPDDQSMPWELLLDGGVVFRTRNERGLYEGTASEATYASAKDLFRIRGAPGRSAVLKRTLPTGDPGGRAVLRSAVIRPHDMSLEDAELEGITYGNLSNASASSGFR